MRFVRCPRCGRQVDWKTAAFRPFCSERCRLLDLGKWAREEYRIPGEPVPPAPIEPDEES